MPKIKDPNAPSTEAQRNILGELLGGWSGHPDLTQVWWPKCAAHWDGEQGDWRPSLTKGVASDLIDQLMSVPEDRRPASFRAWEFANRLLVDQPDWQPPSGVTLTADRRFVRWTPKPLLSQCIDALKALPKPSLGLEDGFYAVGTIFVSIQTSKQSGNQYAIEVFKNPATGRVKKREFAPGLLATLIRKHGIDGFRSITAKEIS